MIGVCCSLGGESLGRGAEGAFRSFISSHARRRLGMNVTWSCSFLFEMSTVRSHSTRSIQGVGLHCESGR